MKLSYNHDDAYKMLLRFRHIPAAIGGFITLSGANVFITDTARHQLIVGISTDTQLVASVFNFSNGPYGEIFEGLCAFCSSATPMIINHKLASTDELMVDAFQNSRLGSFSTAVNVDRTSFNLTLTAIIKYPTI